MEKGNKLQEQLNQLGYETDGEDWDSKDECTECGELLSECSCWDKESEEGAGLLNHTLNGEETK